MSGYESQIEPEDRWAIALYLKALQRSQNALPQDVPAGTREGLTPVDLRPQEDEE